MAQPATLRRSSIVIIAALIMVAVVFAFRVAVDDPGEPVLFFLVIPIGLVASQFGTAGGILAALGALLLVIAWDLTTASDLTPYGYFARGSLFLLSGGTIGTLWNARRELEVQGTHWFEQSADLNCVADLNGNFVRVNRAWSDTLGYSTSELLSTPYTTHVHPDDVEKTVALSSRLAEEVDAAVQLENRYRKADGSYLWLRWTATVDRSRGLIYATAHDVTPMKDLEGRLRDLSQTDSLTGMSNRRHFESEARRQLDFIARYGHRGALFVLDVDRFKTINDTLGHKAGDEALVTLANGMKRRLRQVDLAARVGGDEFAILFPEAGEREAQLLAISLRDAIRSEQESKGESAPVVTSSIGIRLFEATDDLDLDRLFAEADAAMYDAKKAGGDGFALAAADRVR
jgi:diguanylate cyclase (GGDEF)-like protein/PAS domain S-box-containing protein